MKSLNKLFTLLILSIFITSIFATSFTIGQETLPNAGGEDYDDTSTQNTKVNSVTGGTSLSATQRAKLIDAIIAAKPEAYNENFKTTAQETFSDTELIQQAKINGVSDAKITELTTLAQNAGGSTQQGGAVNNVVTQPKLSQSTRNELIKAIMDADSSETFDNLKSLTDTELIATAATIESMDEKLIGKAFKELGSELTPEEQKAKEEEDKKKQALANQEKSQPAMSANSKALSKFLNTPSGTNFYDTLTNQEDKIRLAKWLCPKDCFKKGTDDLDETKAKAKLDKFGNDAKDRRLGIISSTVGQEIAAGLVGYLSGVITGMADQALLNACKDANKLTQFKDPSFNGGWDMHNPIGGASFDINSLYASMDLDTVKLSGTVIQSDDDAYIYTVGVKVFPVYNSTWKIWLRNTCNDDIKIKIPDWNIDGSEGITMEAFTDKNQYYVGGKNGVLKEGECAGGSCRFNQVCIKVLSGSNFNNQQEKCQYITTKFATSLSSTQKSRTYTDTVTNQIKTMSQDEYEKDC